LIIQHFEAQEESHEAMKTLADSMSTLAGQLNWLERIPKSNQLDITINKFPGIMEEVASFIWKWLQNWTHMH